MTATEIVPYLSVTKAREAVTNYSRVFDATPDELCTVLLRLISSRRAVISVMPQKTQRNTKSQESPAVIYEKNVHGPFSCLLVFFVASSFGCGPRPR